MMFNTVAFIGIGLIGSSLARVIKRDNLAKHIICSARKEETRKKAIELGIADEAVADCGEAVKNADLVMICVPLGAYSSVAAAIAPYLKEGAIISDVGSVKVSAINNILPHLPSNVEFVPGHPIAGTEFSGPEAGFAELFEGSKCILTPLQETSEKAVQKVQQLWEKAGMAVEIMDAETHDIILATVSHFPHILAYNLVGLADDIENKINSPVVKFAGSSFRDITRVAASDPVMWRDIFLNNKDTAIDLIDRFSKKISDFRELLAKGDGDELERFFAEKREIKLRNKR